MSTFTFDYVFYEICKNCPHFAWINTNSRFRPSYPTCDKGVKHMANNFIYGGKMSVDQGTFFYCPNKNLHITFAIRGLREKWEKLQ